MKNKKLLVRIKEIKDSSTKDNEAKSLNILTGLNELFIEVLNDFNESTSNYNRWLIGLTIAIAALTLVMLFK